MFKIQCDGKRIISGAQDNFLRVFDFTPTVQLNNLTIVRDILEKEEEIPEDLYPEFEKRRKQKLFQNHVYENAEELTKAVANSARMEGCVGREAEVRTNHFVELPTVSGMSNTTPEAIDDSTNHVYENYGTGTPHTSLPSKTELRRMGAAAEDYEDGVVNINFVNSSDLNAANRPQGAKRHLSSHETKAWDKNELKKGEEPSQEGDVEMGDARESYSGARNSPGGKKVRK